MSTFSSSLYILGISPLSDVEFPQTFSHYVGCLFVKIMLSFILEKLFRFTVSGFTLEPLIHLVLSFMQGGKYGSVCIFLYVDIKLDQYHLLKNLSFFSREYFWLLYKNRVSIGVWIMSGSSILFISVSVLMPMSCHFYYYCSVV